MLALRHPDFRRVWAAQAVSSVGDWFLVIALPIHVYALTRSALATGLVYAAQNLPAVVVGPFAGVWVDRLDRRRLMMAADATRAGLLAIMLLATGPSRLALLLAGAVAERALAQLHVPASAALVPHLVGIGPELVSANAALGGADAVVRLVAAPIGGVVMATTGLAPLLALDSATFAASFVALAGVRDRTGPTPAGPGFRQQLRDGLRHLAAERRVRWVTATMASFLFGNGVLAGQLVPFIVRRLHGDSATLGFLLSALGCGYLVGAAVARRLSNGRTEASVITAALVVVGLGDLLLFNATGLAGAAAGAMVSGAAGSIALIAAATTVQRHSDDAVRGRVTAAAGAVQQVAQVAGTVVGAVTVVLLGLQPTLQIASAAIVVVAGAAAILGGMQVTFRPLVEDDLPMMHRWLNDPQVVRWWEGDDVSWTGVVRDYSPAARAAANDNTEHWIAAADGHDIGWIQCYAAAEEPEEADPWFALGVDRTAAGIDYLIGQADGRGRGLGSAMIRAFVADVVFRRHPAWTQACAAPYAANVASWRALEKAGFRFVGIVDDQDGPCRLMAADRPRPPARNG